MIGLLMAMIPIPKLIYYEEFEGDTERKTAAYKDVREDLSTGSTYKLPKEITFGNWYEEVTYNKDNQAIATKKKYCSKSLLEYLKANSQKYQTRKNDAGYHRKNSNEAEQATKAREMSKMIDVANFEIESYEAEYALAKGQ